MRLNSTCKRAIAVFFSVIGFANFIYAQAPNPPSNPAPPNLGGSVTVNPNICATVSDPNGGNLRVRYFGRKKPAANSKFSIVVLPDTQYYTEEPQGNNGGSVNMLEAQMNWIVNNRVSRNIVYVGHLGDCVQNGDNAPGPIDDIEWQRANTHFSKLENPVTTGLPHGIPYGVSVGNHDQTPNGSPTGTTNFYNLVFGSSRFNGRDYYGGHFGSNNDNYYDLFSAGGVDFLVISMEYDQTAGFAAAGGVLNWVEGLVQTYSNRKVIVITHWAMNESGTFSTQGNSLYNRLRGYPNFIMFLGGHVHTTDGESRRTDVFSGNTVHTIHSDYQARPGGGNGLLRIYEFDPATNQVAVKTYSPFTNTSETDADSEFTLNVNMFPLLNTAAAIPSGTSPCYAWANLSFDTQYEWYMDVSDGTNVTTGPIWSFTTPVGAALPAVLGELTARVDNSKVKLSWSTASEMNNDRFDIERSKDGRNFEKIGSVRTQGNSGSSQHYNFTDENPLPGRSYYQLKQIDIDGKYQQSNIVQIKIQEPLKFSIRPNPVVGDEINIFMKKATTSWVKVTVYDANGQQCYDQVIKNAQNKISIKPNLPGGLYMIRITDEESSETQKMVIR